jgi:hypothetical protein
MVAVRPAILAALTPEPGRPRKMLRQYGLPFSDKWGYSPGSGMTVQFFDNRDIERLHVEGLLEFVDDDRAGRCAILATSKRRMSSHLLGLPRLVGATRGLGASPQAMDLGSKNPAAPKCLLLDPPLSRL